MYQWSLLSVSVVLENQGAFTLKGLKEATHSTKPRL